MQCILYYFPLGNIHFVCCVNWEADIQDIKLNMAYILIFKHKVSACVLIPKHIYKEDFLVLASLLRLLPRNYSKLIKN